MFARAHQFFRSSSSTMPQSAPQHSAPPTASFGIGLARLGSRVRVAGLTGKHPALAKRLAGMGIYPGCELEILQREGGSLIVRVGQSRVALGAGMVHKIRVSEAS